MAEVENYWLTPDQLAALRKKHPEYGIDPYISKERTFIVEATGAVPSHREYKIEIARFNLQTSDPELKAALAKMGIKSEEEKYPKLKERTRKAYEDKAEEYKAESLDSKQDMMKGRVAKKPDIVFHRKDERNISGVPPSALKSTENERMVAAYEKEMEKYTPEQRENMMKKSMLLWEQSRPRLRDLGEVLKSMEKTPDNSTHLSPKEFEKLADKGYTYRSDLVAREDFRGAYENGYISDAKGNKVAEVQSYYNKFTGQRNRFVVTTTDPMLSAVLATLQPMSKEMEKPKLLKQ